MARITTLILALTLTFIFPIIANSKCWVKVKYRADNELINICSNEFQFQPTKKSTFIRGVWYDVKNQYLIIKLNNIYYHYCKMPKEVWNFTKYLHLINSIEDRITSTPNRDSLLRDRCRR